VNFEDIQDPYGIEFWPEYKGRDGCRTPMVWEPSNQNGGFTTGQSWLPVSADHLGRSAAAQEDDPEALLHHYRRAIAFRAAHPALVKGAHQDITADGNILSFTRSLLDETLLCVFNMGDQPTDFKLPSGSWAPIGGDLGGATNMADGRVVLEPYQPFLATKT
jgi:alpha-glucosidase